MSQLHVAMLHLHNGLVDRLRSDGVAEAELFAEARRAATWHYQWVLLEDFLPRLAGAGLAAELLAGGARHYRPAPAAAFIPLEFADAAYRYGHSQVRDRFQVNREAEPAPLFPDLLGFRPVPAALTGRLVLPVRPAGTAAAPAGQADRRPPRLQPHPASPGHLGSTTAMTTARWPSATSSAAMGSGCRRARRWPTASGSSRSPRGGRPRDG
jgi:Animal haem peroxidase